MNKTVIKSLSVELTESTLDMHLRIWKDPETGHIDSFTSYGKITTYTPFDFLRAYPDARNQAINKAIDIWNRGFIQATLVCKSWEDFLRK
ncbi:hypothetical protein [Yersinia ruckeri]|uniref:hypothetical protein n=1 Tax=Yersinia ruckeri TaxID=29486 RepID=UPI0022373E28|nr:hypothetical protein [Yersinia ruckeri]MCW6598642.1 hypothetical protein [Yersinia ruckeri]